MSRTSQAASNEHLLVVDDEPGNIRLLGELLSAEGYRVSIARSGEAALEQVARLRPNLILLDVVMPGLSGYDVCQRLRAEADTRLLPVILVTGARPDEERVRGLDAGADEFLTKPVNREELLARVRSLLRVEALHREVADWNRNLEARVSEQVQQLARLQQLKNFLPRDVADLVVNQDAESLLQPQRRNVTVCAVDLRGFTPFAERTGPEEIIEVLREYYAVIGECAERFGGAVEHFAGDGMVIFFNAPLALESPESAGVAAALDMQQRFAELRARWQERGHELGLGVGVSNGFATIGALGYGDRWQYAAIGPVTNLAARLCGEAGHGEVRASARVLAPLASRLRWRDLGRQTVRGFQEPIRVAAVDGWKSPEDARAVAAGRPAGG